ncbi:hypothetical protein PFISCL1PPCAC_24971, partial [Pristionchus fissidentatus]
SSPSPREKRLINRRAAVERNRNALTPYQKRKQHLIEEAKKNLTVSAEDSALIDTPYVSARTLHRNVLAAVINEDIQKMKELMANPKMPIDALTTQYSFADARIPLVEAFATGKVEVIMPVLIAMIEKRKKGVDTTYYEPISGEMV